MKRPHGFMNDVLNLFIFLFAIALIILLIALLDPAVTRFLRNLLHH